MNTVAAMAHILLLPVGTMASVMLAGCNAPVSVAPAAKADENKLTARTGPEALPVAPSPGKEPSMAMKNEADAAPPRLTPTPPPAATEPRPLPSTGRPSPVPAPRDRVILPAPTQPPAEVDPPHRYPGDEVPREDPARPDR